MSEQTKKTVQEIKESFKRIVEQADGAGKKAAGLDRDLANKIRKVQETSVEVVKHIEERSGK